VGPTDRRAAERSPSLELVGRGYEAWNRADVDAFVALMDPEIVWESSGTFPGLERRYLGVDGVREFWSDFNEPWERMSIEMTEVVEPLPDQVLARVRFSARGRGGIEVERDFGQHYTVRDGRMARMRSYESWEDAVADVLTPEAVIFDNDGLLLDTESVWTRAEQKLYQRRGREFTLEHKQELVGTSAEAAAGILERRLDQPGEGTAIIEELNELVTAELENGVDAMVGARELVDSLRGRGIRLGLVSNSPRRFIERSLEVAGIGNPFEAVISAHEVPRPKPAPDAYLDACRQLGLEPGFGVVALEDSPTGVAAAVAAGLRVVGVPSLPGIELPDAHSELRSLDEPELMPLLGDAG
jgi:HAD superfamily hydrolase (TIGR01509 family)